MDGQRAKRKGGRHLNRKTVARFRLKWLLIAFIPLSVLLALYARHELQRQRIQHAFDRISGLVFDAHFNTNGDCILFARRANVTDSDLTALIPIGSGEASIGGHKVIRLELCGSKVSDAAIDLFDHSAPECKLVR